MSTMTFAQSKTQMNIELGDTGDVTFTTEEKTRALTKAWNDPYVVRTKWDSSLVFDSNTYQHALPSNITTIKEVYVRSSNTTDTEPQKVDAKFWEVIDGNLHFKNGANSRIPDGWTIFLKGNEKIDLDTDTLDTVNLQEYVISLGGYNTLKLLGYKKANLFLKNDTTMGELIALKRDFKADLIEARAKLRREFESV